MFDSPSLYSSLVSSQKYTPAVAPTDRVAGGYCATVFPNFQDPIPSSLLSVLPLFDCYCYRCFVSLLSSALSSTPQ